MKYGVFQNLRGGWSLVFADGKITGNFETANLARATAEMNGYLFDGSLGHVGEFADADCARALNALAAVAHASAAEKGFWERDINFAEAAALMHSEISEAVEAERRGIEDSPHIDGYSAVAEELADTILRVLDWCGARKIDIGGAVFAKLKFNRTRPFRHGKEF